MTSLMTAKITAKSLRHIGTWSQGARHNMARAVGWIGFRLAKSRVRIARINLRKCFPDWTDERIDDTIKTHMSYFSHALFDRTLFWFGDVKSLHTNTRMVDAHHFEAARAQNRPIILLAPHFVGLDAGGLRINMDFEMATMYQKQSNPIFDELMLEGRSRSGQGHLYSRHDGVRGLVKLLRKNIPLYYLPDMDFGVKDAVFVDFFGNSAATLTALPKLAKFTNALIVPCITRIDSDELAAGRTMYNIQFYPAWDGYPGDDETAAVRDMNRFIEERILEEPAQYLWLHKRFKTRPAGEASFYIK